MKGSCNCGSVTFEIAGPCRSVSMCHCGQCRKQSGHFWASAVADEAAINIQGAVTWYRSSQYAQRGFCQTCGCFLFWKHDDETSLSFSLGAIDGPTELKVEKHIFVADKGDYYEIADGVPQYDQ